MPLPPGSRFGPFEILAPLGEGGMGEVYRGRDTKLHRDVAIKVLPDNMARDSERLARFEREARTLASLNHPNIAQIHGLEGDGVNVRSMLVMELVDGENLAAVIARGPLAIEDARAIASQIAQALDAAHSAGIVHRDLKPANVMVRPDGGVKVLDFGLAKAPGTRESASLGHADIINSPTFTSPAVTQAGMLLGTAAYMSPEQARGRAVDKRADIWAFGCVLYEMLAGRAAFQGETITDVLGSIVKSDADWTSLPAETPDHVVDLLKRCLQKDVARRLRDIGDAIPELDAATMARETDRTVRTPPVAPQGWRRFAVLAWIGSLAAVAAISAAAAFYMRPSVEEQLLKFQLAVQETGGVIREPAISPDGRHVVYVGRSRLWVQSVDEWQPRELAGTEAAVRPFWSHDGHWIGYFRSEMLLKVPAGGGPVVRVASLPAVQAPLSSNSAVWAPDGHIILSLASGPMLRVPAGGGEVKPFVNIPADVALDLHDLELLPDGSLLVGVHTTSGVNAIGVVKDGVLRVIHEASGVAHPTYSPRGYLLFERRAPNAGLWAARFSLGSLALTGEPFLIGTGTEPSVSRNGTLTFLAQPQNLSRQLAWFSLDGQIGERIAEPREWIEGATLSHDGTRVLASAADGLWAYDVATGARSRITTGASDMTPDWIDSNRIVFVRTEGSDPVVVLKDLRVGGAERTLARAARFPRATADGRRVVFNLRRPIPDGMTAMMRAWDVAWTDLDRPDEIQRLPDVHAGARFPSVSPDGTLVAYISGEVGRDEIFLTRLPSGEGKWQLSDAGGGWALFTPRGDAVLYRAPDGAFMSVAITGGADVKIGRPQKLFEWGANWMPFFDIDRDGKRGVAAIPIDKTQHVPSLSVVQNWHLEFPDR